MRVAADFTQSPEAIWAVLSDFGGMASWCNDLASSTQSVGAGLEPGATRELVFAQPSGDTTGVTERIVQVGPYWFAYELVGGVGPYPRAGSHWMVEARGTGSRVIVRSHIGGGPLLARLLKPLAVMQLRAGLKRAFKDLAAAFVDD